MRSFGLGSAHGANQKRMGRVLSVYIAGVLHYVDSIEESEALLLVYVGNKTRKNHFIPMGRIINMINLSQY